MVIIPAKFSLDRSPLSSLAWFASGSGRRQLHLAHPGLEGRDEQEEEAAQSEGEQEAELADTH